MVSRGYYYNIKSTLVPIANISKGTVMVVVFVIWDFYNGATLLLWAVGMEKYKSAETLLKCGANSGFSWVDNDAKKRS